MSAAELEQHLKPYLQVHQDALNTNTPGHAYTAEQSLYMLLAMTAQVLDNQKQLSERLTALEKNNQTHTQSTQQPAHSLPQEDTLTKEYMEEFLKRFNKLSGR